MFEMMKLIVGEFVPFVASCHAYAADAYAAMPTQPMPTQPCIRTAQRKAADASAHGKARRGQSTLSGSHSGVQSTKRTSAAE